ncbi:MAG: 3'-5' exonuclease [Candidatus Peribacteraceae bacterium]
MPAFPPITVFDIETTGLDPRKGHRIIEIAGLRMENGVADPSKAFISFVNPERLIPWETKQIHKITDDIVHNAPGIEEVLPKFLAYAEGSVLAAHNAAFDMSFLEHEKELCWGYIDLPECLCTMRLSQALFPREFGHSLEAVARRLKIPIPSQRHRALPDVQLTLEALLKMLEMKNIGSFEELRNLSSLKIPA